MSLRLIFDQAFPGENPFRRLAFEIAASANSDEFGNTNLEPDNVNLPFNLFANAAIDSDFSRPQTRLDAGNNESTLWGGVADGGLYSSRRV